MVQAQVIEGTSEEIAALLQAGAFVGQKLRVIVESEEEDFTEDLPAPPDKVRDAAHVDPALVIRYFGSKEGLFREAAAQAFGAQRKNH